MPAVGRRFPENNLYIFINIFCALVCMYAFFFLVWEYKAASVNTHIHVYNNFLYYTICRVALVK